MLVAVKSMLQLIIILYRQLFECVISLSDCSVTDLCLIQYIFHFSFYVVVSFSFSFSFFFLKKKTFLFPNYFPNIPF